MTIDEYFKAVEQLEERFNKEKNTLVKQYIKDNRIAEKGDIAIGNFAIIVEKLLYHQDSQNNIKLFYHGELLCANLKKRKHYSDRRLSHDRITKVIKKKDHNL